MRSLTVHVTQEDIDNGERQSCSRCPVARAIARALQVSETRVTVASRIAVFDQRVAPLTTPRKVMSFITAFDGERPVEPFSFDLQFVETV